ncbi:GNAT family N-acetyltransferase [Haloarchaeobius sp. HME9146]|uniref:GNAT family N-acetyltransferase n=1 Tax=Haloarchaeobius sp. HME9146 TaxID=2978732 RepID=UPI0021C191E7|nr:GNAT family N-acetyltransferase [Haloarchaeobius sp. HME9146]MCT9096977.1 GNAT family N-acetyltransferase [Haloarchaeobius sp. HME9146]
MQLVEATEDDIDTLIDCWYTLASGMEDYSRFNELVYDDPAEVPEDGFVRLLESEDVTNYLVEVDGETIGWVTLREGEHPSREYTSYTQLVNLLIDEEYRNQGYGAEVVSRVKELAKENDCDHLKVSCEWANESARRFYRDTGFEEKQVAFVQEIE